MHYYTTDSHISEMRERIRELEETNVAQELVIAQALDQIDEGLGRERRLLWTVLGFGTVMVVAIITATWPGR